MKIPKKLLKTKDRKEMWKEAEQVIKKIDRTLDISEAYVIGSYASNKKRPCDVDIAIVTKVKNRAKNSAWPIDVVIIPENEDTERILSDINKWMKNRYKQSTEIIRIK